MLIDILSGKTALVTGHNGFKGSWLTSWLKQLNCKVVGVSLDPPTSPSHFQAAGIGVGVSEYSFDISNGEKLADVVSLTQPDFVFHLAAQSLVRRSYENPSETWRTNVLGTINMLDALRFVKKPCAAVMITSDKCYENVEWIWGYRENDALGGLDPYSASKGSAELAIRSYVKSYFADSSQKVRIASARAGNVIGGGDWADDRIIPDCIKAWSSDEIVELRNPSSTRPWQHVLEPLSGYLCLAAKMMSDLSLHGEAFNFGPKFAENYSVETLVEKMGSRWDKVRWEYKPIENGHVYESNLLNLNCDKANSYLRWHSTLNFEETVELTVDWYRNYYQKPNDIGQVTENQIINFTKLAKQRGLTWAM